LSRLSAPPVRTEKEELKEEKKDEEDSIIVCVLFCFAFFLLKEKIIAEKHEIF
jgi:hypothetical protein